MSPTVFIKLLGWAALSISTAAFLLATYGLFGGLLAAEEPARPTVFNLEGQMYAATTAQAIRTMVMVALVVVIAVSILALVAAVGLLKRRGWARKLMTGLLVLGAVVSLWIFFGNLSLVSLLGPIAAVAAILQVLAIRKLLARDVRASFV